MSSMIKADALIMPNDVVVDLRDEQKSGNSTNANCDSLRLPSKNMCTVSRTIRVAT